MKHALTFSVLRRLFFTLMLIICALFALVLVLIFNNRADELQRDTLRCHAWALQLKKAAEAFDRAQNALHAAHYAQTERDFAAARAALTLFYAETQKADYVPVYDEASFDAEAMAFSGALCVLKTSNSGGEAVFLAREALEQAQMRLENCRSRLRFLLNIEDQYRYTMREQSGRLLTRMTIALIGFILFMTCVAVLGSYFLSEALQRALRELSEGARRLRSGELSFRFKGLSADEQTDSLKHDFNAMAFKLESQNRALISTRDQLLLMNESLKEAHVHKDRFLANMSHELRTPLNAVIGFAELLHARAGQLSAEKVAHYADLVLEASQHLHALISDLLDLARIDAGGRRIVFEWFDMNACVNNVFAMLRVIALEKKLELVLENPFAEGEERMRGDRRFFTQILINLLNNALKFTEKGVVGLRIEKDEHERRFCVYDSGIGIAPDDQSRIFEDFHRVENTLSGQYKGVGLGLTLTRRLVAFHSGTIGVESQPGQGSTFTVHIPLQPNENMTENKGEPL